MKTNITQPSSNLCRLGRNLLPALLVALFILGAFTAGAQVYTVGNGTSQYTGSSTIPSPLGYYNPTSRWQFMYDSSELRTAGFPATGTSFRIDQISFNVGNVNAGLPGKNYQIRILETTLGSLTTFINPTLFTTVYTDAAGVTPTTGWNTITLNTPFTWNGGNLVIELCNASTVASYNTNGNAGVYYNTVSNRSIYYYSGSAASACGVHPVPSTYTTTQRPNIRFTKLQPCSGTPSAGTLSTTGTVTTLCPGTSLTLAAINSTNALNTVLEWFKGPSATGPWTSVGNTDRIVTGAMVTSTYFYFKITCLNSGAVDSTPKTGFTFASGPTYGSIPYFESFEAWSNGCANSDKISSGNWTNIPPSGDGTWRRDDQEATAGAYTTYTYNKPKPIHGSYMARWLAYYTPVNKEGTLNLYLDFSTHPGPKDVEFWVNFTYPSSGSAYDDSLNVEMSTDGGATFSKLPGGQLGYGNMLGKFGIWTFIQVKNLMSNSATTVVRFRSKHSYQYMYDHYVDAVRIVPPCTAKPTAGKIDTVKTCTGKPFTLSVTGASQAAGLTYLWQYLPAGATVWQNLPGGNVAKPTAIISTNTAFRVILTCTNTTPNLDDTSAVWNATLSPFYLCYCVAPSTVTSPPNFYNKIGNMTIANTSTGAILLNNGNATPQISNTNDNNLAFYNDYALKPGVPIPRLIRDTSYKFTATVVTASTYLYTGNYFPLGIWVDFDRNGVFSPGERIFEKFVSGSTTAKLSADFVIPSNAQIGLTGMRIFTGYINATPPTINPCGGFYYPGEVEDYLVYLEYPPCGGPVNAGIASISDTSVCPGYSIELYDTSYEKTRTGILREWEYSVNGGASWDVIPGSSQKDTMSNVVVATGSQYRLRVRCSVTGDTTYSNVLNVSTPIPVRCYPVSQAGIGGVDSSDIGAVILGDGLVNPGPLVTAGPHLFNPQARKRRTDYTLLTPVNLIADSTYRLAIFHTMPRGNHSDALVSVFMDFNNNLRYDAGSELVYQGTTSSSNFFLDTRITIPNAVIPNVLTGMRVIVNNDLNPLSPANMGAGNFTSGEVEDYIVIFRRTPLGVNNPGILQNLALYPNPSEGKFTVLSDASRSVAKLDVVVTTITGQQVLSRSFENVGMHFTTNLDLSAEAKGVYFVEIRADGEKITRKLIVR